MLVYPFQKTEKPRKRLPSEFEPKEEIAGNHGQMVNKAGYQEVARVGVALTCENKAA